MKRNTDSLFAIAIIPVLVAVALLLFPHGEIRSAPLPFQVTGAFAQNHRVGHFNGVPTGSCNAGVDMAIDTTNTTLSFCNGSGAWNPEPFNNLIYCGTLVACGNTLEYAGHYVIGTAALTSGTPSTATITGVTPAFTSASTYSCQVTDKTTLTNIVGVLAAGYVSGSSFVITGPSTITDVVNYNCSGW
jgi:hypothetical protein